MKILLPGRPMVHARTTILAAAILIAGCRTANTPGTTVQPAVIAPTNDTSVESYGPWVLTPSRQPYSYHSTSQTTVRELSDSGNHQNSIKVTAAFTVSLDRLKKPLTISGHIDSVTFSPENELALSNNSLTLPLSFEGEVAGTIKITVNNRQPGETSCSPFISSILSDLRTALVTYPMHLTPGLTWRDSTLVTTCTGGFPTTRKAIQLFRVVGERAFNTTRALVVQRLDSTYISGDGAQDNHQIHLEGFGTGTSNIYISPTIAFTLAVESSEKTEIAITNSGKTRHFVQEVTQRLNAKN